MGFFTQIQGPIRAVIDQIISDQNLHEKITYRRYGSDDFDRELGHNVALYTNTAFYAVRLKHTDKSIQVLGIADLQIGDFLFMCRASDMPTGYSLKDQIVDVESRTLKIKKIDNIFDLAFSITVEGG